MDFFSDSMTVITINKNKTVEPTQYDEELVFNHLPR